LHPGSLLVKAHRGGLSRQPRTPLIQPAIDLLVDLLLADETLQGRDQLADHDWQQYGRFFVAADDAVETFLVAAEPAGDRGESLRTQGRRLSEHPSIQPKLELRTIERSIHQRSAHDS
jgi:hypothetical protein